MSNTSDYLDITLLETLRETGAPRILTTRNDGTTVYVALSEDGQLVEVTL